MNSLQLRAMVAGIFFGLWPLLMNKSHLNGMISPMFFELVMLMCTTPVAIFYISSHPYEFEKVVWIMLVLAGVTAGIGTLFFNSMLGQATEPEVGKLIVMMILVQISIPAIYDAFVNGKLTIKHGVGFVLAILASLCLS